jgi:hypothetical protein
MFAQWCLEVNNKVDDLDALLKFKAACAVEATAEANNGTYTSTICHFMSCRKLKLLRAMIS